MSRHRNKTVEWFANWGEGSMINETFDESSYPGPCNCAHISYPIYQLSHDDGKQWIKDRIVTLDPIISAINDNNSSLNWNKLPSSTKTGLIQILAEIDDTIAIFTVKFWKSLTYGSFTWGVIPFVSDLVAVYDAVRNLAVDLSDFSYEDSYSVDVDLVLSDNSIRTIDCSCKLDYHLQGRADYSFQHPASKALDWLGLHPDLATAWDLVPFSFVVDYLIPIGDYLQTFRQGGWIKAIRFSGWRSCHTTFTPEFSLKVPGSGTCSEGEIYIRSLDATILTVDPPKVLPSFTLPSFRQMFNMMYLLITHRNK